MKCWIMYYSYGSWEDYQKTAIAVYTDYKVAKRELESMNNKLHDFQELMNNESFNYDDNIEVVATDKYIKKYKEMCEFFGYGQDEDFYDVRYSLDEQHDYFLTECELYDTKSTD